MYIKGPLALQPKYLSIDGHWNCTGANQKQNSTSSTVCLHLDQPEMCTNNAWNQLSGLGESEALEPCLNRGRKEL